MPHDANAAQYEENLVHRKAIFYPDTGRSRQCLGTFAGLAISWERGILCSHAISAQ